MPNYTTNDLAVLGENRVRQLLESVQGYGSSGMIIQLPIWRLTDKRGVSSIELTPHNLPRCY
jgi:hypothetical protein